MPIYLLLARQPRRWR